MYMYVYIYIYRYVYTYALLLDAHMGSRSKSEASDPRQQGDTFVPIVTTMKSR